MTNVIDMLFCFTVGMLAITAFAGLTKVVGFVHDLFERRRG